jgi:hypothetical protein
VIGAFKKILQYAKTPTYFLLLYIGSFQNRNSFCSTQSLLCFPPSLSLLHFIVHIPHIHFRMLSSQSFVLLGFALSSLPKFGNAYTLVAKYDSTNFFDEFTFFTGADPTNGFVDYVSQSVANSSDLVYYQNDQVYLGVDYITSNPSGGRASVRLTSNEAYSELLFSFLLSHLSSKKWQKIAANSSSTAQGLFIADIAHMPGGICGTWPAFWMFGVHLSSSLPTLLSSLNSS